MNFTNLDEIDQQILKLLSSNGRMSHVEIGKRVNLSRVAVKYRIENLEKKGIIESYSVVINPHKLGRMVSAFLDLEVEAQYLYCVADQLVKKECITDIYQMTGDSNLHVHAMLGLNEDLEQFLREEIYPLEGMKRIKCNLIVSRIKVRSGIRL